MSNVKWKMIPVVLPSSMSESSKQSAWTNESDRCIDAKREQRYPNREACVTRQTLRALPDSNAPIDQKQPGTVCQMPYCGSDADDVDDKNRHDAKLTRNNSKGLV